MAEAGRTPGLFGIVNITRDSFSDGGLAFEPDRAIARALQLFDEGASVIDLGAASSHPDAEAVAPEEEIFRLAPVVRELQILNIPVSVDSFSPEVQRWAMEQGVAFLNDIHGFPEEGLYRELADFGGRLVVMHAVQESGPATRTDVRPDEILARIQAYFGRRIARLESAGISRERIILDPGMGFFLGADPEVSLTVLRALPEIRAAFGLPVLVSVSRKSFIGALTSQPATKRGAGTLAAELFAVDQGADFLRTHDVAALRDALRVTDALRRRPPR